MRASIENNWTCHNRRHHGPQGFEIIHQNRLLFLTVSFRLLNLRTRVSCTDLFQIVFLFLKFLNLGQERIGCLHGCVGNLALGYIAM